MTEQNVPRDLRNLFALLEAQGLNPRMCDTPIPFYDRHVPCGKPSEMGDSVPDGYMLLPHGVRGVEARFSISVAGDSMKDAGIEDGDELDVISTPVANDGDIVVAVVEGESTVKMYFTDDFGRKWLVPRNKDFSPVPMAKYESAYIAGRVVKVHKEAQRGKYRELNYIVSQSPDYVVPVKEDRSERLKRAVRKVAPRVQQKRQWYAVYRALVDAGVIEKNSHGDFVHMVCSIVPGHAALPSKAELYRVEVDSFRHAVKDWREDYAPVTGSRFDAYVSIANAVFEALK